MDIDLHTKRVTTLEKALIKLREEQAVENFAAEFVDSESTVDDGTDGHMSVKVVNGSPAVASVSTVKWNDDPAEFEDYDEFADYDFDEVPANIVPLPAEDIIFSIGEPHKRKRLLLCSSVMAEHRTIISACSLAGRILPLQQKGSKMQRMPAAY